MKEMLEKYLDDEDDMKSIHLSAKCDLSLRKLLPCGLSDLHQSS